MTVFNQAVKWKHIEILDKILSLVDDQDQYVKITIQDLKDALKATDNKGKGEGGRTIWNRAMYANPDKVLETQERNHETVPQKSKHSIIDVLEKLLKFCKKAKLTNEELKEQLRTGNQKGNTALHLAVKKGLVEEIKWLLNLIKNENLEELGNKDKSIINATNKKGMTALYWAAQGAQWDIAVTLLNHGAEIKDLSGEQCDLLKTHIEQGNAENKSQLLQRIEQRLLTSVENLEAVEKQAAQIWLEPMDVEAGPSCSARRHH